MPDIDIIIPLGTGSKYFNDELRILLRSVERNVSGLRRVIVVTQEPPPFLVNAVVLNRGDVLRFNKDGNLINKVMHALYNLDITGKFVIAADDNVFVQEVELSGIPQLFNNRRREDFDDDRRWTRRMRRTFDFFESLGVSLDRNFEVHAPQVFDADKLKRLVNKVDYESDIGYGIYTLFRGLCGELEGEPQGRYKTTHDTEESANAPMNRMFAGYKDASFKHGLRSRLLEMFPYKSKYEK